MKINTVLNLNFFDGKNVKNHILPKHLYWFGTSNSEEILKSEISFFDEQLGEISISIFNNSRNTVHKHLSNLNAPTSGFIINDLLDLSKEFQFDIVETSHGNYEGICSGNKLRLMIRIENNKQFFLIYSIVGGRAPEAIYFFGLYEIIMDVEFYDRYFNDINFHTAEIKETFNDYLKFLEISKEVISIKEELIDYLNYTKKLGKSLNDYVDSMNQENSINLYSTIGSMCRYFSEFNWNDDYRFYQEAKTFLEKLTKTKTLIYNYFNDPIAN